MMTLDNIGRWTISNGSLDDTQRIWATNRLEVTSIKPPLPPRSSYLAPLQHLFHRLCVSASLIATATMTQNTDNPLPLPSAHQAPQDQTGAAINAPQDVTEVDSFVRGRGQRGVRTAPQGVHQTPRLCKLYIT
jgi:hypothetical protein